MQNNCPFPRTVYCPRRRISPDGAETFLGRLGEILRSVRHRLHLFQLEGNGQGVSDAGGVAAALGGFPVGHFADYAQRFFLELSLALLAHGILVDVGILAELLVG